MWRYADNYELFLQTVNNLRNGSIGRVPVSLIKHLMGLAAGAKQSKTARQRGNCITALVTNIEKIRRKKH